jgi:hypothetical protein
MPLQTTFYDKVTAAGTVQLYDLGTVRVEGSKVYKYFKNSGASLANNTACTGTARGSVKLTAVNLKAIGVNVTGAAIADGSYFWAQVAGEVGPIDTSGATAVGYALNALDADGTLTGAAASATAIGNSIVTVDNATGYAELSGLL